MGSAPSKGPQEEYPRTITPQLVIVQPRRGQASREETEQWNRLEGALDKHKLSRAKEPFYVLLRGEGRKLSKLDAAQIGRLEPIGQARIAGVAEEWSEENPLLKYAYTWPPPTGELSRLADRAIWKCTEFSSKARITVPSDVWSPGGTLVFAASPYTILLDGSAFTLGVAADLANSANFNLRDMDWDALEGRILRNLQTGGAYKTWHETLGPEEKRTFATAEMAAKLMRHHIKGVVRSSLTSG
jgi:hypothetical protein